MRTEDVDLLNLLHAARRNTVWSLQDKNSPITNMHIGTTQHLIELAISIIKSRKEKHHERL